MKKRMAKVAVAASAAVLAFGLSACVAGSDGQVDPEIDPALNEPEDVYGPPVIDDFEPEEEMIETVYGPPEYFEGESVE